MIEGFNTRKVSGECETFDFYGKVERAQTLSCCHCQKTRVLQKGSGRVWGWCAKCPGYHCDDPKCFECIPLERRWDNLESGRAELTPMPVSIVVPTEFEGLK